MHRKWCQTFGKSGPVYKIIIKSYRSIVTPSKQSISSCRMVPPKTMNIIFKQTYRVHLSYCNCTDCDFPKTSPWGDAGTSSPVPRRTTKTPDFPCAVRCPATWPPSLAGYCHISQFPEYPPEKDTGVTWDTAAQPWKLIAPTCYGAVWAN